MADQARIIDKDKDGPKTEYYEINENNGEETVAMLRSLFG